MYRCFLLLLFIILLTGCGGDVPRGTVHGTLKFQGKPLSGSTIILIASDNQTHRAEIGKDGSYSIPGVAYGKVNVSIQQEVARVPVRPQFERMKGGMAETKDGQIAPPPNDAVKLPYTLPALYADPTNSGLTFDLTTPDVEWSKDLK
jgi:hypothetical protein